VSDLQQLIGVMRRDVRIVPVLSLSAMLKVLPKVNAIRLIIVKKKTTGMKIAESVRISHVNRPT
jgi:hypothetical protein